MDKRLRDHVLELAERIARLTADLVLAEVEREEARARVTELESENLRLRRRVALAETESALARGVLVATADGRRLSS